MIVFSKAYGRVMLYCLALTIIGGCAGSGMAGSSYDWREYKQSYSTMQSVVQEAVKERALKINTVRETEAGQEFHVIFSRNTTIDNQDVQKEQGEMILQKVSDSTSRVRIENPDYHFSIPDHERVDYKRILFPQIDKILQQQN